MNVALTGATGFIGSHILTELVSHGHGVIALVRDDTQAVTVAQRGAKAVVVDLYDTPAVIKVFNDADGAVHTASPGDATSAARRGRTRRPATFDARSSKLPGSGSMATTEAFG